MTTRRANGKDGDSGGEPDGQAEDPGTSEQLPLDDEPADRQVPEGELEPPPQAAAELAILCIEYVERSLGVALDFTDETLPILDHYTIGAKDEIERRPEVGLLLARAVGAYFGEVLRHRFGGFWRMPSENVADWQWCARSVFLAVNPIGVAFDALWRSDEHAGPSSRLRVLAEDRATLDARLSQIPPVAADDYYRLTTRIEAIEVAMVALRARMSETGYDGIEFDEDDYAAEERQF